MKSEITMKPGGIFLWKEYSFFKRLWNKIWGKELPLNRLSVLHHDLTMITTSGHFEDGTWQLYEPKKAYSKAEKQQLLHLHLDNAKNRKTVPKIDEIEDLILINTVRPNTFDMSTITLDTIKDNKYYRRVYAIQK